ncbi:MAG: hypothetical protein JNK82_25750 [Myxococcaceae bacterium]|nr:hypothetical protein [Myxococcaceae bacterium]
MCRFGVSVLVLLAGCAHLHRAVDGAAIDDKVRLVLTLPPTPAKRPLPWSDAASLEQVTRPEPLVFTTEPLEQHRLHREGLVQERWSYDSKLKVRFEGSNRAAVYVYRAGELGERPIVLWVPGLAVDASAFPAIRGLISEAVDRGADVVFIVPPYHLERTPPGHGSGDVLMATDATDHFTALAQGLQELRSVLAWLVDLHPPKLGAFAGSMGAAALTRAMSFDGGLDFATLFIPVVAWEDMVFGIARMEPVRAQLRNAGVPDEEARAMYAALDGSSTVPPKRAHVSVLAARYDLIARRAPLERLVERWRLKEPVWLESGHAGALLLPSTSRLYAKLLDEDLPRPK